MDDFVHVRKDYKEIPPMSECAVKVQQLLEFPLFKGESPDTIEWILEYCPVRKLEAGEVLLHPNELNSTLFVMLEGSMQIQLQSRSGPAVYYPQPGDCMGEMSLLDGRHTSAFVAAISDCRVLAIPGDRVWSLINRSYVVSRNLLGILSSRLRRNNDLLNESYNLQRIYETHAKLDPLTELHNRRWLDEVLERLVHRSNFRRGQLGVIMLDIDCFKSFNDEHGHVAGDSALRTFAGTVSAYLRPNDAAARYGGDEFVILLPDTDLQATREIAERLVAAVSRQPIRLSDGNILPPLTVSAGIAEMQPGTTRDELISAADAASYRAKREGRDRVCD